MNIQRFCLSFPSLFPTPHKVIRYLVVFLFLTGCLWIFDFFQRWSSKTKLVLLALVITKHLKQHREQIRHLCRIQAFRTRFNLNEAHPTSEAHPPRGGGASSSSAAALFAALNEASAIFVMSSGSSRAVESLRSCF